VRWQSARSEDHEKGVASRPDVVAKQLKPQEKTDAGIVQEHGAFAFLLGGTMIPYWLEGVLTYASLTHMMRCRCEMWIWFLSSAHWAFSWRPDEMEQFKADADTWDYVLSLAAMTTNTRSFDSDA
jgi:hypothetical protein